MLSPIDLYHSPATKLKLKPKLPLSNAIKTEEASERSTACFTSSDVEVDKVEKKRSRSARACDVCRSNHRKCPGPNPDSPSCERCIRQHKDCTWDQAHSKASTSVSPKSRRFNIVVKHHHQQEQCGSSAKSFARPKAQLETVGINELSSPLWCSSNSGVSQPETPPLKGHSVGVGTCQDSVMPMEKSLDSMPMSMSMKDCNGQIPPEGPIQLLNQQHLTVQPPQCPHSESPDYHTDLLHIANQHNILLFAFSLQAWSEQPPPHHNPTSLLHCVSPSHIQPQPGPEESLTLLRALISPEKVEELGDGETQKVAQEPFSPHIIASDASVEETFLTPPSSTAAEENLSEPELFINHQPSSQLESPYRQSDDPFLYSPNHCFDSPRNPWNESTVEKWLEDEEQKWDINWDETLPVLEDPSHDEMLQDWFGSNIAEYKFV